MANHSNDNVAVKKAVIIAIIVVTLIVGGGFLIRQNAIDQENKKDPEKILGKTIGEIEKKYCAGSNTHYDRFYIRERTFTCYDFDDLFADSDLDNYKLVYYNFSVDNYGTWYFGFEVDETQIDQKPLKIDNPKQFVGKMATDLCPKYSLVDFKIYAAGEHMGVETIPCKDINKYSMFQNVVITGVYYGADEESGDNPDEYFEQNNAKGTRTLYFDGEYMKDRLSH